MKRYEVNIEETVVETFSFELPDDVDIYDYVQENYYNCNIVLEPGECQFKQMQIQNLDDDSWTEWKEVWISTKENAWILDPFAGSSTTGIAANLLNRRFLGLEQEQEFLELSKNRREEIEDISKRYEYREKIIKYSDKPLETILELHENEPYYGKDLPIDTIYWKLL